MLIDSKVFEKNFILNSGLIVLMGVVVGCSVPRLPVYPEKSVGEYKHSIKSQGLSVAVQPLTHKEEVEQYFGTDLVSKHILPVFILAHNTHSTSSFILSKEHFSFGRANERMDDATKATVSNPNTVTQGVALGGIILFPIAMPLLIPLAIVGANMESDANEIRHNFLEKEFHSKTLSPTQVVKGFVYFQLPKEERSDQEEDWVVTITAVTARTTERTKFEFPIQLEGVKREPIQDDQSDSY